MTKRKTWLLTALVLAAVGLAALYLLRPSPIEIGEQANIALFARYCHTDDLSPRNLEDGDVFYLKENGSECCLDGGATLAVTGLTDSHVIARVEYPKDIEYPSGTRVRHPAFTEHDLYQIHCRPGATIAIRKSVYRDIRSGWEKDCRDEAARHAYTDHERQRAETEKERVLRQAGGQNAPTTSEAP